VGKEMMVAQILVVIQFRQAVEVLVVLVLLSQVELRVAMVAEVHHLIHLGVLLLHQVKMLQELTITQVVAVAALLMCPVLVAVAQAAEVLVVGKTQAEVFLLPQVLQIQAVVAVVTIQMVLPQQQVVLEL
jgi:hypothetical protein